MQFMNRSTFLASTVLGFLLNSLPLKAESRSYNGGYFGAPINVGGENSYSSYGSGQPTGTFGFNSPNGLNGISTGSNGYSGSHNLNNYGSQYPFGQSGGLFPGVNFGGNSAFFPSNGYFANNFGGFGLQRHFNGNGFGHYGLSSGYPTSTGYNGIGSGFGGAFGGLNGFAHYGNHFGNGINYGNQVPFK